MNQCLAKAMGERTGGKRGEHVDDFGKKARPCSMQIVASNSIVVAEAKRPSLIDMRREFFKFRILIERRCERAIHKRP